MQGIVFSGQFPNGVAAAGDVLAYRVRKGGGTARVRAFDVARVHKDA